ncbi:serine hydrolase domain-containing protein [Umezawaea beigongshangensis]|uniref:serine hydrolase domain-containing protein n=1 Tax=Umezawaea beigongshangensis TaxID=2780383 RepID=UPI0018F1F3EB|nr:serine hydrolase domain-containing protein [Umezawaea beigongshangensis]
MPDPLADDLAELADRHGVPGAQLGLRRGDEVVSLAVGLGRDEAVPLGSLTKPFTAALVLALVQDGDVDLDAPLADQLPHFAPGAAVTARHLLSHTSGLMSDVPAEDGPAGGRRAWVATCPEETVHPPGTVFSYSNVGYLVAGHLAEEITGMEWADAVTAIVLDPLDVRPGFVPGPSERPVAVGHSALGARIVPVAEHDLTELEAPTGALALSADDLLAFVAGCRGDVGEAMRADALAGVEIGPYGMADGWGLGWARYDGGWHGHDGTGPGTSCHVRFDRDSAVALTTVANTGAALWRDLVARLRARGFPVGDHPPPPGRAVAPPPGCAGSYANGDAVFSVADGPDGLVLSLDGRPHSDLTCHGGLRFTLRERAAGRVRHAGRFVAGPDGIEHLQLTGRLARRVR